MGITGDQSVDARAPDWRMSEPVPVREYLRPTKWRNAARRRTFERIIPRRVKLYPGVDTEQMGSGYGGWPVPVGLLNRCSVVYSVGAGGDLSFDLGLVERTGCEVHSFDPASAAAEHFAAHRDRHRRLTFHNVAIWTHSGELMMYRAANPSHMALSVVNLQQTARSIVVPCRTIESVRVELGHSQIDLIKLTIDGGEYDLVPQLDLSRWRTTVLVVALHHNRPVSDAVALIAYLRGRGYVPVARRDTTYTLVRASLFAVTPSAPASGTTASSGQ